MNSMTAPEGALSVYGPGHKLVLTLAEWRKQFRTQQVAFRLAREVCQRWQLEQADTTDDKAVPMQVLFPKVAFAAKRFLQEKVICKGTSQPCDVLLVGKYQQQAVDVLFESIRRGGGLAQSPELPRIPKGSAGRGSTRFVDYHTRKDTYHVNRCHLNAMVADTKKWEQSAGFALDTHPGVVKWVKNEHLGFVIPYRKNGVASSYIPDFIAETDIGLKLILETKGQYRDDADLKAKASERWVKAVNEDGNWGMWLYVMVSDPSALPNILNEHASAQWDAESLELKK